MLSILKANADACTSYVRMEDLEPGSYAIKKFSLRESKFGGKRLVIDLDRGYMYLPEKMVRQVNTEAAIAKLNKERYNLVYYGRDDYALYRLRFTFAINHPSNVECDDEDCEDDEGKNDTNTGGDESDGFKGFATDERDSSTMNTVIENLFGQSVNSFNKKKTAGAANKKK